jgi:hypothetical protein
MKGGMAGTSSPSALACAGQPSRGARRGDRRLDRARQELRVGLELTLSPKHVSGTVFWVSAYVEVEVGRHGLLGPQTYTEEPSLIPLSSVPSCRIQVWPIAAGYPTL